MSIRTLFSRVMLVPLAVGAITLAGCGDDPAAPAEAGHTPASAKLFVNNVDVTSNLVLDATETTVEVRFYASDGDQITGIEDSHYAGLTFTPDTLATPAAVVDEHFFFDVTAQASAGTGSVMVGYGHDVDADELSFGPFPVEVTP